jgi:tetratricopeptide (TPR) repeat protein/transglutaminase-like putative cysteine protease
VDARKSAAALALSLRDPPLGFVLVPEKLPAGRTFTLGEALGIFKANLKGRMGPAFRLSSEQQRPVGGLPGTELIFLAGSREAPLRYVSWSTLHGSYFYTLYTWGDARIPRAKLLHQARRLASKFSILEEERAPEPPLFQSAKFGYSVDLEGSPLRPSEALRSSLPYAEFTASDDATTGLAVFPVSRLSLDPDPGLALAALEHFLQLRGPLRTAESTQDGRRVLEREYRTRSQGVRFVYRVRLYGGEPLILAMVWSGAEPEESLPERLALLDRVRVGPSQSEPARVEGLSAEERTRHAFFLTALGAAESERGNFAQAIRSFALAQELAPDDAGIRQLVVGLQLQMGRYDAVLQTTDEALSRSPDDAKLHAFRGMARLNTGDTAGALEDLARSQELGFEDEGVFEQYVALLLQQGRAEEAETRLDERIARTRSPRLRKDRAVVRRSLGKFEESIAELEALLERDPGNHELALELAASHLEAGDGQKALELTQPLVDAGWPSAQLHFVRARAQFQLGRYTEATAALERAIERDPALPGATEFRDLLSAALGEGDNRLVRNPIEPVPPLAAASRSTAAAEAPPEGAAEFGAYYLSKSTGVRYERDAEYRSTTRWVARVVGRKGIERVSSAQFAFDPVLEEIFVNDLTVRGPDGEVATRGRPSDYYVLDPSDTSFVTHKKTLHVAIRGVEVGSSVELTVTTRRKAALDRFDFVAYLFSDLVPVLHSEFYVLGDIGELAAVESGGVERAEVEGALVWRREQPPVVRIEPLQQSPMRYLPALWVGDRDASWEAVGREYLETIAERLEPSEDAAALAARTAGDAGTPREQALRLAGYAQSHLQYRGVAFGRRAYVPNPVDRILEAKAGDCKDHALLLYHLLRAQGIRSELALVSLSQPVQTEIPSLAQFDHLVVRCEECGGLRFLDTTDKDFRLGSGVPRYLGGRWALVLDPERPHLEQIPEPRLDQNELSLQRTVRVSDGGGAEVEEHLLMGGASGAWARGALRQVERDQWREVFLHGSFGTADGLRFHSLEAEGIEDATRPVALDLSYELSRRFTASGDRLVGRLPALWEHLILDVVPVEPRTAPFRIETPLRLAVTVRLEGPSRFSLSDPPGATEATGRIVRWRRTVEPAKDLLVLRYDIARESGLYPADAYAGYQREVKGLLADLEAVVAFHREPPRSPPLP